MSKTRVQLDEDHARRLRAFKRVREVLSTGHTTESGKPIIHMITTYRKSATFMIRPFVITLPEIVCVDVSAEVSEIVCLRYSQAHRAVIINAMGLNTHALLAERLGRALYGFEVTEPPLHYRSI